jgi:hypothetical protein
MNMEKSNLVKKKPQNPCTIDIRNTIKQKAIEQPSRIILRELALSAICPKAS